MLSKANFNYSLMYLQNKSFLFLLIFFALFLLWCCNSGNSNSANTTTEESEIDDYFFLRNPDQVHRRPTEDLRGTVIVLSEKDFIERITVVDNPKGFQYKGQTPCVVELYANWCKPCGYMSQVMDEVAPEYAGRVIFYKIDIDRGRKVSEAFNVSDIPVLLFFKPRSAISKTVGYINHQELRNAIDEYLLKP